MEYNIPPVQSSPYEAPINSMGSAIMQLTDPSTLFRDFALDLAGAVETDNKIISVAPPVCNEIGIRRIISTVKSCNNQGIIMSRYDQDNKEKILMRTADALIQLIQQHSRRYAIQDAATATWIVITAINYSESAINRALEQGERGFWKGSQQDIRHIIGNQSAEKKGISRLFNWGRTGS